jgi:hypothetical protein
MKVLYIAANPRETQVKSSGSEIAISVGSLNLEREITELQRRFMELSPDPVSLIILPDLKVEDLPGALGRIEPDILHLSAHGEKSHLSLAREDHKSVKVTARMLCDFFSPNRPPRLVYVNACNSAEIARALVGPVEVAIGSTAPITNRAARAAAVVFYERILRGLTIEQAFAAGKSLVEALDDVKIELFSRNDVNPATEILRPVAQLAAEFEGGTTTKDGSYQFRIGITNCPSTTKSIIVLNEDEALSVDADTLYCISLRGPPKNHQIWSRTLLSVNKDCQLLAVGITSDASRFTIQSSLCQAIEGYYATLGKIREDVTWAVDSLRGRRR